MYAARLVGSLIDSHAPMQAFFDLNLDATMFVNQERELVDWVLAHIGEYGTFPTREAVADATTTGNVKIPIPVHGQAAESPQYYYDKATHQFLHKNIRQAALDIQDFLGVNDVKAALNLMGQAAIDLQRVRNKNQLLDFAQDGFTHVMKEVKKKTLLGDKYGLTTGWPTLDEMSGGGLIGGDVLSIVGRPAMGKTYKLLRIAQHCWNTGKVPLVVSMEMKPLPIMQRLAGMTSQIPVHLIKAAQLSTNAHDKLISNLLSNQEKQPFWVIDGALSSTVPDILMATKQLKPDVVFIDGAYLLRHSNPKIPRWERVTENAEMVKADLAEACDIPVVQSYQFNRKANEKKSGAPSVDNIAYTDAIGQLSSLVLGILQEESVETLRRRHIEVLKGRDGQIGGFDINWVFDYGAEEAPMQFDEVSQSVEDLSFM